MGGAKGESGWRDEIAGVQRRVQDREDGGRKDGRSEGGREVEQGEVGSFMFGRARQRLRDGVLGALNVKRQN